jgi:hypothetical protein
MLLLALTLIALDIIGALALSYAGRRIPPP